MNITKSGIILSNNIIEETQYDKQGSIYKEIKPNLLSGYVNVITNKNGTIESSITITYITGDIVQSLAGQTLCMSYEVKCNGSRYSAEQGQTAWQYTRYGIHGSINIDGTIYYPFANYLHYSGEAIRTIQTWTIPTNGTNYGTLGFSVQNFDKPASTNNEIWYIKNLKIEIGDHATPFIMSDFLIGGNAISTKEVIEI